MAFSIPINENCIGQCCNADPCCYETDTTCFYSQTRPTHKPAVPFAIGLNISGENDCPNENDPPQGWNGDYLLVNNFGNPCLHASWGYETDDPEDIICGLPRAVDVGAFISLLGAPNEIEIFGNLTAGASGQFGALTGQICSGTGTVKFEDLVGIDLPIDSCCSGEAHAGIAKITELIWCWQIDPENPPVASYTPAGMFAAKNISQGKKLALPIIDPVKHPCKHRSDSRKGQQQCETCKGKVMISVFECGKFGECTTNQHFKNIHACKGCPLYEVR